MIAIIFKLTIFVRGGHCDYLSQAPRNIATPLVMVQFKVVSQNVSQRTEEFIKISIGTATLLALTWNHRPPDDKGVVRTQPQHLFGTVIQMTVSI
jgi:hypothetical protein